MARQSGEDIGEPGARIDAVELGGLDQGVHGGGAAAAGIGSGEGPVAAADRDGRGWRARRRCSRCRCGRRRGSG